MVHGARDEYHWHVAEAIFVAEHPIIDRVVPQLSLIRAEIVI